MDGITTCRSCSVVGVSLSWVGSFPAIEAVVELLFAMLLSELNSVIAERRLKWYTAVQGVYFVYLPPQCDACSVSHRALYDQYRWCFFLLSRSKKRHVRVILYEVYLCIVYSFFLRKRGGGGSASW